MEVGLVSVGSFTTSFKRAYDRTPTEYRAAHPAAAQRARIPTCFQMAAARPPGARRVPMPLAARDSSFGEDTAGVNP
jgi:AraC-like DNA-binding protein